jgi:hypothetical protein
MDDDYILCSSSTEQGEIPVISIKRHKQDRQVLPRQKSYLRHMYLPGTSLFIGPNTVPRSCSYQGSNLTTRMKKKLKQDLPYPFLCFPLDSDRTFFSNKFLHIADVVPKGSNRLSLAAVKYNKRSERVLEVQHIREAVGDGYREMHSQFGSAKLAKANGIAFDRRLNIMIKDSALSGLGKRERYTHFRVVRGEDRTLVVFEESYIREVGYYDYLRMYGEEAVKSLGFTETRIYTSEDVLLMVCSYTTLVEQNESRRVYASIDVPRSLEVVVNTESVRLVDCDEALGNEVGLVLGIEYDTGEYVLNDGRVYRIDPSGKSIEFVGMDFSGFVSDDEP